MDKKKKNIFRFTLVNHFTLEKLDGVFALGRDVSSAIRNLRRLFPTALYDVEEVMMVDNPSLVIVGYSNLEVLL